MFNNLTFEYPLVFLVFFIFLFCARFCKPKVQSYYMPHLNIYNETSALTSSFSTLLKWVTILFAIIALASPVKESNIIHNKTDGIDIILSLDTSGSMGRSDFNKKNLNQNRWDVVSEIVKDFIKARINDNIGLIAFGDTVMMASPLTYDKQALVKIIDTLNVGIVGQKTVLYDSIAMSLNILNKRNNKTKILIVLTDGADYISDIPLNIINKLAKKHKIKIYTIGIGISKESRIILNEISESSGAKSFIANNKDSLKDVYEYINQLEKSEIDQNKIVVKDYFFFYPLFISFLCLVFFIFLRNKI